MTGTLTFDGIKLYGFHGMHKEEALVGTNFTIDIKAQLIVNYKTQVPNLRNSVNYEDLRKVLKTSFEKREDMIEEVALNIYWALKEHFKQVEKWRIRIEKQNPLGDESFNPAFTLSDFGEEEM